MKTKIYVKAQHPQEKGKTSLKLASASCDNTIKVWVYDAGLN